MKLIRGLAAVAVLVMPIEARAQSLLDRSPNVSGDWVGAPGTLYFHFVHRFVTSRAPERKVSNVPTFLLAAGLPKRVLAGFNYSTNSTLAPRFPNEWEAFGRWMPVAEDYGGPLDIAAQVGYNNAAEGVDGEVSVARKFGPARLIVAGRGLSDPFEAGNPRFAVAGGATMRIGQYLAFAGDVVTLADRDSTERVAWGAGIHFAIPSTPHTVSLHATNAPVTTLQGSSRGTSTVRYGFEFTIPLTLRRYFGRRAESPDSTTIVAAVSDSGDAAPTAAVEAPPIPQPVIITPAAPPPVAQPPAAPPPAPVTPSRADTARSRTTQPKAPPTTTRTAVSSTPARSTPARPAARTVSTSIKNINYLQPRLQIAVGTTIEWKNNDPLPHSVTATDKSFDSGLIQPGKIYRHTFTKAGTYNFFCVPHPFMKGVVVVRP